MPTNYRYPSKEDFESQSKQGTMSDVDASSLYREKIDKNLVGTTDHSFVSSEDFPSGKGSIHNTMDIASKSVKQGDMG